VSSEILAKLENQGHQILQGHSDIVLVDSEVNLIWELEASELNEKHRAVIIEHLRNNRKNFAKKKAAGRGRKPATPVPTGGIDLGDLDLDLKL
jgi:hypothetical protein